MCEPTTIMAIASTAGTVMQGYAAKQQGDYDNQVAKYNARRTENEAQMVRNKGTEEENRLRRNTAELKAKQRAQLAAGNVDINSGSALNLQTDTDILGEADARLIRSNTGYQQQAMVDQAELTRLEGRQKKSAGNMAFGSSLLMAGASIAASGVADKWFSTDSAAMTSQNAGSLNYNPAQQMTSQNAGSLNYGRSSSLIGGTRF